MSEGFATMRDGARIAWAMAGEGPVLLLANSLGTDRSMWDGQVAAFGEHRRVLRYDMRGHGRSDAPPGEYGLAQLAGDAIELLDAHGIDRADVCGVSLGGMIAQWLGANAPERLRRIVIANSSSYMGPPEAWAARIALIRAQGMAAIADMAVQRWFSPRFQESDPAAVARIRAMLLTTPADGYCGCCAAIAAMDMRPELARIKVPALVIGGLDDPATPPEHAHALHDGIVASRLVELRAAHLSNIEQAEAFTRAVLEFLVE
jgi:3-oxoadipate enol-lactonase